MTFTQTVLATTLLIGVSTCYADVCQYGPGSVTCGAGTVATVTANGVATLNGTTITNQLTVDGHLTATSATINNMTTSGSCIMSKTTLSGTGIVSGLLNATNSTIRQTLTLNSTASILAASTTANIAVNVSGSTRLNSLCLENNTHTGTITFSNGTGTVYESGGSSATNVVNGQVIQGICPQN